MAAQHAQPTAEPATMSIYLSNGDLTEIAILDEMEFHSQTFQLVKVSGAFFNPWVFYPAKKQMHSPQELANTMYYHMPSESAEYRNLPQKMKDWLDWCC